MGGKVGWHTPLCGRLRKGSTHPTDVQQAQHSHVPFLSSMVGWIFAVAVCAPKVVFGQTAQGIEVA